MAERWRILAHVTDLRARLASNASAQLRQAEARAQAALEQSRRLQSYYEGLAAEASSLAASLHAEGEAGFGKAGFTAEEAQILLGYAVAARLKAQEALTPLRRAQQMYQRAQAAADESAERSRRALRRHEAVASQRLERARAAQRAKSDREEQTLVEERARNPRASVERE